MYIGIFRLLTAATAALNIAFAATSWMEDLLAMEDAAKEKTAN